MSTNCNKQANGRYKIDYVELPTDAEPAARAGRPPPRRRGHDIDIIGMDVIWTAEFAEAEWIQPWEGERREAAAEGKLEGPLETVEYKGKVWAIPFTSNTQLLWYRKDLVEAAAHETWDEMIDEAGRQGQGHRGPGRPVRGPDVWVNSLIAGAGGQIVDEDGDVKVDDSGQARRRDR